MKKAVFVIANGAKALYVGHQLVTEGDTGLDSLESDQIWDVTVRHELFYDTNWLDIMGEFPENLDELYENEEMLRQDGY